MSRNVLRTWYRNSRQHFRKSKRPRGNRVTFFLKANLAVLEPPFFPTHLRGSQNFWGRTPLHRAAEKGHDVAVQQLLEAKALVDAKDTTFGASDDWGKHFEAWYSIVVRKWMECCMVRFLRFCRKTIYKIVFIWWSWKVRKAKKSGPEDIVNIRQHVVLFSASMFLWPLTCLPLCVHSAKRFNLVRFWRDDCYLK